MPHALRQAAGRPINYGNRGLAPKPGAKIALVVGYLFGNSEGTTVAARACWQSNSFTANVTNDIPLESRLEPAEWGEALVE